MSIAPDDLATAVTPSIPTRPPIRTAADWLASLGDVPLDRILFDPLPGTATEADLLRLVERDKRLCELIDGTLVEKTMGWEEGQIEVRISTVVATFVYARRLGSVGSASTTIRMLGPNIRLPDVSYYSNETLATRERGVSVPRLVPDLAIEVLSKGNSRSEMALKLAEYFEAGTRLVWYVDPRTRSVDVYTSTTAVTHLTDADTLTGGDVLPGFEVHVAEFFAID